MIFRLKSLIVQKFGRPIEKRSDCEALALDIEIAVWTCNKIPHNKLSYAANI